MSHANGGKSLDPSAPPIQSLSTAALQNKLRQLREGSQKDSQLLTQKLASSQSGQNLLHIGTSLSTLPPDLHSLLTHLHPILSQTEHSEKQQLEKLQELVDCAQEIRLLERRVQHAGECADLYADLVAAEASLKPQKTDTTSDSYHQQDLLDDEGEGAAELDHASSLERAAHITLCLVQDLRTATETVSTLTSSLKRGSGNPTATAAEGGSSPASLPTLHNLPQDSERAQFLLKLAPRIRRLESDTSRELSTKLDSTLKELQNARENDQSTQESLLLMLGHCMRGLALLGRGKDVETIFARVAIMPLIRSKVSMGRLDEGGARGECAGLFSLLDDMAHSIFVAFSPALRLAESMFQVGDEMDVDLLTCGVWVPIATALMADAGIKMAIFSPGIASILQANYMALDTFLSELATRLLKEDSSFDSSTVTSSSSADSMMFRPTVTPARIQQAQDRIYLHPKTAEFSKKWNLPIYYQLRLGDCCTRLNKAVEQTTREGWTAQVYTGDDQEKLKHQAGFELSLFLELYDILLGLWRPDVIIRPLANRFLRGSVQLVGRTLAFVSDGMVGTIKFGAIEEPELNGISENGKDGPPAYSSSSLYCWGDSAENVAAVAWELTILESVLRHDYVDVVVDALETSAGSDRSEIRTVVSEVLKEASDQLQPIIDKAWNELVVNIITAKCSGPLGAVKGVAATYRMTNRPPPTQASPFVATILRPLDEFSAEFLNRTPDRVGSRWKQQVVVTIADRYAAAVEELIATVQRTEVALNNRRARRTSAGGMRDGEKVKLQLFLDYQMFAQCVTSVGVEPATVIGLSKLEQLTLEGAALLKRDEHASS